MFMIALAYALWPSNKKKFEQAAQLPLRNDGDLP
jgi:cbb3-type cytochrome oxidase subunit 3